MTCYRLQLHCHHLPLLYYLADACYDLQTEIADLKENAVVEVAAAVDWHSAVVDVVTEQVSTT